MEVRRDMWGRRYGSFLLQEVRRCAILPAESRPLVVKSQTRRRGDAVQGRHEGLLHADGPCQDCVINGAGPWSALDSYEYAFSQLHASGFFRNHGSDATDAASWPPTHCRMMSNRIA